MKATRTRAGWAAAAVAALAVTAQPAAWAHDSVIGGNPGNGEVVEEFPGTLALEFSGHPKEGFNTFALSRVADGTPDVLYSGEPALDGRWVSLDLPAGFEAEPGEYRIGFQIISSDGHATKGMTTFTYAPAGSDGTVEAAQEPVDVTDEETSSNLTLILLVLGVVALAGAAIAAFGKRKRSEQLDTELDQEDDK